VLTYGTIDKASERWLQRTLSQVGEQLADVRDRIFTLASPQRHHVVLDLNAVSGLLTWEALRRVPEGGVYACVRTAADAKALEEQAAALPELMRPILLTEKLNKLPKVLTDVRFDCIIGRNALLHETDKKAAAKLLAKLLRSEGVIVLAETVARHTQRLYRLLNPKKVDKDLFDRIVIAEEAIYTETSDPMVNWDADDLRTAIVAAGLVVQVQKERIPTQMHITPALLERWFSPTVNRPTYATRLAEKLSQEEVLAVKDLFSRYLLNQTVTWESSIAFVQAHR